VATADRHAPANRVSPYRLDLRLAGTAFYLRIKYNIAPII